MESGNLDKYLYFVREASALLNISEQSVTRMIRKKELQAEKIGKNYRIPRKEIERLLMLSSKDLSMDHFNAARELELENEKLRQQINLLKNILQSANSILER